MPTTHFYLLFPISQEQIPGGLSRAFIASPDGDAFLAQHVTEDRALIFNSVYGWLSDAMKRVADRYALETLSYVNGAVATIGTSEVPSAVKEIDFLLDSFRDSPADIALLLDESSESVAAALIASDRPGYTCRSDLGFEFLLDHLRDVRSLLQGAQDCGMAVIYVDLLNAA